MGNNDDGLFPGHPAKRIDNVPSGFQIDLADRVVQNQDLSLLQQAAGDGDSLFLTTRQDNPLFAHNRVKAAGKFLDGIV